MSSTPARSQSAVSAEDTKVAMPEHIALDKWADSGFDWAGEVAPIAFERLAALLIPEHEQPNLQLTANLYQHNSVPYLDFKVAGNVWLTCQRCLQPVEIKP